MINKTIVALDQLSKNEIQTLIPKLNDFSYFKIGLELFNKFGKEYVVRFNNDYSKKIFLDLKLHDIPKTVYRAIKGLEGLPIEFLTIHLSGGQNMIVEALEAQRKYLPNTKLLGVSYLTSLGANDFFSLYGASNKDQMDVLFKNLFNVG